MNDRCVNVNFPNVFVHIIPNLNEICCTNVIWKNEVQPNKAWTNVALTVLVMTFRCFGIAQRVLSIILTMNRERWAENIM